MTMPFEDDTETRLAERIRGFNHDDASPTEQAQLCGMLKQLAEQTVARWEAVNKLEVELRDKLSMADIREKMSEVLVITGEGNHAINRATDTAMNTLLDRCEVQLLPEVRWPWHWRFPR